jgi:predicted nicotinamide N-methyase
MGLPPPFWAFAWAGGQALARHVMDEPVLVRGKRVIDLASGSGLVGLAAMKAGAASVLATDIDAFSLEAIRLNAVLNGIDLAVTGEDLLAGPAPDCDVILVGDLFYEKDLAGRVLSWLEQAEARGITALIGDPGRSYLPRERLTKLGEYRVQVARDLEDAEIKLTSVWRLSRYC